MTLPASGPISLSEVNVELSKSATDLISLDDQEVRTLAQVPTGTISMSDLWGKSASLYAPGTLWFAGCTLSKIGCTGTANNKGGLPGDGTNTIRLVPRSSPIQIGSLSNWKQISSQRSMTYGYVYAAGSYQCTDAMAIAVKTDGTLWRFGAGGFIFGTTSFVSSPVQVGSLTNWKYINISNQSAGAIKTDGTLWTWGDNIRGQLGLNNRTRRSSPVQVGSLTNWKYISVGGHQCRPDVNTSTGLAYTSMFAVKTDGTLWSWGDNNRGQLGSGNRTSRSSPVQVGSLTNWNIVRNGGFDTITSVHAIKTDGTLWAWGGNFNGQLGTGNRTYFSSPVQIGSLTNWKYITVNKRSVHAIKTDGTLWAWGYNSQGQLGSGNRTSVSSPIQIGSLTNWSKFATNSPVAIKTDGTIWYLGGSNPNCLPSIVRVSSPVQIGSLSNWKSVSDYFGIR